MYLALPDCARLYLALTWSAMIYLYTDCHILALPLTGLNAYVYTGFQWMVGWMDGNLCKHLF